jgi:hypothetical protein
MLSVLMRQKLHLLKRTRSFQGLFWMLVETRTPMLQSHGNRLWLRSSTTLIGLLKQSVFQTCTLMSSGTARLLLLTQWKEPSPEQVEVRFCDSWLLLIKASLPLESLPIRLLTGLLFYVVLFLATCCSAYLQQSFF